MQCLVRALAIVTVATCIVACGRPSGTVAVPEDARAVLKRYCVGCHNDAEFAGELSFEKNDPASVAGHADVWERVLRKLETRTMPPQPEPRPEAATYSSFSAWLEAELDRSATQNPGRPALRRLNRSEYANAIHDLLGFDVDVAALLPPDDSAFGFDNIGDLLVVSPSLLERYLAAADRVSALALGDSSAETGAVTYRNRGDQSQTQHLEGLPLGTVGGLAADHYFPLDGQYEIKVTLLRTNLDAIRGLEHTHQLEIAVDGERLLLEPVGGERDAERKGQLIPDRSEAVDVRLRVRAPIKAGQHHVTAAFVRKVGEGTNRLRPFDRSNADTYDSTGRPHVQAFTVTGPYSPTGPGDTVSRRRILACTPENGADETRCARDIIGTFARRAYRRPVDDSDLERLMPFFEAGRASGTFDSGIQLALRRVLASPAFVFRVEQEPADVAPGAAYRISDLELATRLAFFLWSSLPDDELVQSAAANQLHEPGELKAQVLRMLADPRADALAANFAGQWLHLRNLENINPNSDFFPDFDNDLRQAFRREAELFFGSVVRENRSVLDLMTGDYTFVNERLARHYGIPNVYGSQFRRVALGDGLESRRGLLGKGGVLWATSHADRTAPTLRGKWVMENLLGSAPPPPPAVVPALDEGPAAAPRTMRERMQKHRAAPACFSCHGLIDPLGFAMENFDAVGRWRDYDGTNKIDATGGLPNGTAVDGIAALRGALVSDPRLFAGTVTEKLLTYALGRGLQSYDMPVVRGILRDAARDKYRFDDIVLGIVRSAPFEMRTKQKAN